MSTNKFSSFVIGGDSLLIECSEILIQQGHTIRGVITAAPRVERWARGKGLNVIDASANFRDALKAEPFDFLFAITHLAILPDDVIALPKRAAINFHDGPLPRYAGLNTPAWALIHREPSYGISWHLMTPGIDEGELLEQRTFEVSPRETSLTINTRCFEVGMSSFAELIDKLASGTEQRTGQDRSQRSYFGKYDRPDALCALDFSKSASELDALARALDFGQYENPLGVAKLIHGGKAFAVARTEPVEPPDEGGPGAVLALSDDALVVGTSDGAISLAGFSTLMGEAITGSALASQLGIQVGSRLDALDPALAQRLTALGKELAKSEAGFMRRLSTLEPIEIPYASTDSGRSKGAHRTIEIAIPPALLQALEPVPAVDAATIAVLAFLSRLGGKARFDVSYREPALDAKTAGIETFVAKRVPLRVEVEGEADIRALCDKQSAELARIRKWGTYLHDAPARRSDLRARPELRGLALPVVVAQGEQPADYVLPDGAVIALWIAPDGKRCTALCDKAALGTREAGAFERQLNAFLDELAQNPSRPIGELALLSAADRKRILTDWNQTAVEYRRDVCVHQLFEETAARTPDAIAVVFEEQQLSYRELNERANRLASYLRTLGVGPDKLVGVCVERSLDLMVSILAVQKAGGAYVPLDPSYPADRIAFMVEDSAVSVLLSQSALRNELPTSHARVVCVDDDPEIAKQPSDNVKSGVTSANLAYCIYTSGSTGKPKGVMVEHRNVVNFFRGMDPVIAHEPGSVWFAVTSLSFDISVLELFWTLSKGFKIVLYLDRQRGDGPAVVPTKLLDFSLFLWGADDQASRNKYDLMLDAARFADNNGFSAVWTPERHFHAFGGPYPNPSVTGAAIAAVTSQVQVRAGSCVVPLHHPARVAEEWAVVDNISRGRVGISFASGWQPDDFLLRPQNFKEAKKVMTESIDIVRRLWRGEKLAFDGPLGKPVEIVTQPRPVQAELPYWVTSAGNAETYRIAGAMGANVLTHLLGQTLDEVAEKIRVYRQARADAGFDPNSGIVSLMLHTFVGEDDDEVRELVRAPMKDYLRSSVALIKNFAWAFPAFKRPKGEGASPNDIDLNSLTTDEMEAILDFAFERYFEASGLFGTEETCAKMIERCRAAGVDDIACLIDFGVSTQTVLASLKNLASLHKRANAAFAAAAGKPAELDYSPPAQFERHGVTHMQCTPSMARMLLMSDAGRKALRSLKHLMVGGEAFPVALAKELGGLMTGTITNMYGPTETTIWSSTHRVRGIDESIPIGRPIANTQLYVLDSRMQPVPIGVPGDLYIAGDGVVRGYLGRPELTKERFIPDPYAQAKDARMYKTGDLARFRDDGVLDFLGRSDFQVKIRGYRIELGEIETLLNQQVSVREGVVVAREDTPGDQRIVAYVVPAGSAPSANELRDALRVKLPEYMVPSHVVILDRLPLTPNGKIDRKALPAPDAATARAEAPYVPPAGELEETIAAAWKETLGLEQVGTKDNFFDLGGHSLLVVRLHRRLTGSTPRPLSITDLYRFPTISSLSEYLSADPNASGLAESDDRAKLRLEMRNKRRRGRE